MQKNFLSILFIFSLFFTGCTSYSITKYFDKDEFYNKAIQYTKKADVNNNGQVLAMMNATYLNSVSSDFNNDKQNFVIAIYHVNEETEQGLHHSEYILLLNDKEPVKVEELAADDILNTNIPLKNHWAKYYFVSFEKVPVKFFEEENHTLQLSYENIKERNIYLAQKEKEEQENKMLSLLDEIEPSTLVQVGKASVSFLKEL